MITLQNIEKTAVWGKAEELGREIDKLSKQGLSLNGFNWRRRIRQTTSAVISNVAEGYEQGDTRGLLQSFTTAKTSADKIRAQLYVAVSKGYISKEKFGQLFILANETSCLISNLMSPLRKSSAKKR